MSHPKYSGLADQVTHRRLDHLQRFRGSKPTPQAKVREVPADEPKQLGIFEEPIPIEVHHHYDAKSREVEWAYYTAAGCFLLQFGFSLLDRSYQIYSIHAALFQDQDEMRRHREAINRNLAGHYPALELVWESGDGPLIRRRQA